MEENQDSNVYYYEDYEKRIINGKPLSYKTGDVARIIGENDQTIRNYCRDFKGFLDLKHKSGEHRAFSEYDLRKILFIKYLLKEKKYSVKQANEYLSTPNGKSLTKIEDIQDIQDTTKIEFLANLMTEKLTPVLLETVAKAMQENLNVPLQNINTSIKESENEIKSELASLANSTNSNLEEIKKEVCRSEQLTEGMLRVEKLIEKTRKNIIEREERERAEALKQEANKGFFSKFFKRKK